MNLQLQAPSLAGHPSLGYFFLRREQPGQWLRRRALNNQHTGASRTFVVCDETGPVWGAITRWPLVPWQHKRPPAADAAQYA